MAYQPMFNAGAAFNPMSMMMGETEEERRRREEEEARRQQEAMMVAGPVAPPTPGLTESEVTPGYQYQAPKPQPFKQTLTIDPVTGEQRMKMEGSPQDFTAANPLTPTVSMPGMPVAGPMAPAADTGPTPEEIMRDEEQRRQYDLMMAQPAAGPVAPAAQPVQMAAAAPTTMTDVSAGMTGPIAAAPAQAMSPEQLQAQMMQQDIQEGPPVRQLVAEGAGPMAMNWFNVVQAAQNDPAAMERIARDPNTPEQWRRVAAGQSRMTLDQKRQQERAEAQADRIIAGGDTRVNRVLARPEEKGSYLKAYLFGRLGMQDLARAEQAKLTMTWDQDTDDAGNRVLVQRRGDGMPVRGIDAEGNEIDPTRLMAYAGGGAASKFKPEVSGTAYVKRDDQGNVTARGVRVTEMRGGRTRTMIESGGRRFDINQGWEPESISTAEAKAVAQKQINLAYDPIISAAKAGAEFLGKFNAEHGTNFAIQGYDNNRNPVVVDRNTNQVVNNTPTGVVTATTSRTSAPRGTTPADIKSGREIQEATSKEFIKINADNANKQADKASAAPGLLSAIDNIIRQTEERPQFFNAMQTPAYRAFAAAQGPEAAARLKELSDAVRIDEKDRPRFNQLMNDIKRLELAGITSSGLTASQLNTERESQRVVNAFAVNTSDSPQAARIQAEIARAQVIYQREFARFLGRADPTQNPARLRTQFDEQIGDKIWTDLYPKLEAIQRGGVVDFRSKR